MSVSVGNQLDTRKRKGQRSVGSGMHIVSGMCCQDARGSEGSGMR